MSLITIQASQTQFSIQYATGAVYGTLAYDTMTLGGISIPNQALGVVRQAGKELLQSSCDGIIVSDYCPFSYSCFNLESLVSLAAAT